MSSKQEEKAVSIMFSVIAIIIISLTFLMLWSNSYFHKTTVGTVRYDIDQVNPFETPITNFVTIVAVKDGWCLVHCTGRFMDIKRPYRRSSMCYLYPYHVKGTGEPAWWEYSTVVDLER